MSTGTPTEQDDGTEQAQALLVRLRGETTDSEKASAANALKACRYGFYGFLLEVLMFLLEVLMRIGSGRQTSLTGIAAIFLTGVALVLLLTSISDALDAVRLRRMVIGLEETLRLKGKRP